MNFYIVEMREPNRDGVFSEWGVLQRRHEGNYIKQRLDALKIIDQWQHCGFFNGCEFRIVEVDTAKP
jgi:hypothetical protein